MAAKAVKIGIDANMDNHEFGELKGETPAMRFNFDDLPVIDNHCHPFPTNRVPEVIEYAWSTSLYPLTKEELRSSAYFQMSTSEMCRYHGVSDVDEMFADRKARYTKNPKQYTQELWKDANIQMLIADIGSPVTNKRLTERELEEFADINDSVDIGYVNRIENVTDDLLPLQLPFEEFENCFVSGVKKMVRDQKLIALKSIIAYRTGLEVKPVPIEEVKENYYLYLTDQRNKQAEKYIRDYIFFLSGEICKELDIPLQIHTGAGVSPLTDMRLNNPLLLADALNDPRFRDTRVMMVHAGNPDVEYAAYLVGQYPNVFLDISYMLPYCGYSIEDKIRGIFGFAPFNKVMYGSDGGVIPDHFWFAAKYFKRILAKTMDRFVEDHILSVSFAENAAKWILSENAKKCYKLD